MIIIIHHLIYSCLYQKTYTVLTSTGWNSSQSSLRCSSQVIILKFGMSKTFSFLGWVNFSTLFTSTLANLG